MPLLYHVSVSRNVVVVFICHSSELTENLLGVIIIDPPLVLRPFCCYFSGNVFGQLRTAC